jgi:hypothetical protein
VFVRWHVKKRSERKPWHSPLLTATLVESRRVDGQPRQRVVAYLGAIREARARDPELPDLQFRFWTQVSARLDRLANRLSPEQRAAIEARLAERVSRPTAEEAAAAEAKITAEIEAWYKGLTKLLSHRRRSRHPHGISRGLEENIRAALIADEKPTWAIACDLRVGERTVVRVQRRMAREAAGGDAGAIPTP